MPAHPQHAVRRVAALVSAAAVALAAGPLATGAYAAKPPAKPTITSGPAALTNATTATLTFSSAEAGVQFDCSLDGATYARCASPTAYSGLAGGAHTFRVRSVNAAGTTSAAAQHQWTIDLTPPPAPVISSPVPSASATDVSFSFTDAEAGVTFRCALDAATPAACTSPASYGAIAEGTHTFAVRAVDAVGNTSTPASVTWLTDRTGPAAPVFTSVPATPTKNTTAVFAFRGEVGSGFACALGSAPVATCASPYTVTLPGEGSYTFVVQAVDGSGNPGGVVTHAWTVDLTAPDTAAFVSGPDAITNATTAAFAFAPIEPGASLACSLDGAAFAACPAEYAGLAEGDHVLAAQVTDAAGNTTAPANWAWTVDVTPPAAPVVTGPDPLTNLTTATFGITTAADATATCTLDGAALACNDPLTVDGPLADGTHTLAVAATDAAGNVTSTSHTWTVDATAPLPPAVTAPELTNQSTVAVAYDGEGTLACAVDGDVWDACPTTLTLTDGGHTIRARATDAAGNTSPATQHVVTVDLVAPGTTITGGPAPLTSATAAEVAFGTDDATALTWCSIDGQPAAACTSPATFPGLADGAHTVSVHATDAAGNVGAAVTHTWTVDATAPVAPTIASGPAALANAATAAFSITADDALECALDGAAYAACSATPSLTGLADGAHAFAVRAVDPAGNRSSAATWNWTVDTTAPTSTLGVPAGLTGAVAVHFGEPLTGATAAIRVAGATANLPATVTCGATSCTVKPAASLVAGQRYQVTVTAVDAAGNAVTPAVHPFRASLAEQETSAAYGWRKAAAASALGTTYHVERVAGARADFAFRGTGVIWWTMTGPTQGTASIYVDGVFKMNVNNYSAAYRWKVGRTISGLSNANHTLSIVVRGARGSTAGTDTQIVVDGMTSSLKLQSSPMLAFGWGGLAATGLSGGRAVRANLGGAAAQFTFRGTGITWTTVVGRDMGRAAIYVDGVLKATVDNYASATAYGVVRRVTGLSDAVHTVRVVALGTRRTGATGTWVVVDKFTVA